MSYELRSRLLKLNVTDTALDIASTVEQTTPIVGNVEFNDGGFALNATTHEVTVVESGRYQLRGYLAFGESAPSNTARNDMRFFWQVNGVTVSPNYQNNYLRDQQGHIESGQGFPVLTLALNAADVVRMRHVQISGAGGVMTLSGPPNYVEIEKVR